MVLAPNGLFSWNNKYSKYMNIYIAKVFTFIFLLSTTTHSVHAGISKPWGGRLPCPVVVFSSHVYHVLSLSLPRLNWRSLSPPPGPVPPFPKMASLFTGSAHTPFPGSTTETMSCQQGFIIFGNNCRVIRICFHQQMPSVFTIREQIRIP